MSLTKIASDSTPVLSTVDEMFPPDRHGYRCSKVTQRSLRLNSFRIPSDCQIPPRDHNTCYVEGCMADTIVCHTVLLFVVGSFSVLCMYADLEW